jgi:hypothetical protein
MIDQPKNDFSGATFEARSVNNFSTLNAIFKPPTSL